MRDAVRHLLVYIVTATVIGTVWTLGWARSENDRTEMGFYPPARPELYQKAIQFKDGDDKQDNSSKQDQPPVASINPDER